VAPATAAATVGPVTPGRQEPGDAVLAWSPTVPEPCTAYDKNSCTKAGHIPLSHRDGRPKRRLAARAREWIHAKTESNAGAGAKLESTLKRLGFEAAGRGSWRHPEGRVHFRLESDPNRLRDEGLVVYEGDHEYRFHCGWMKELKRAGNLWKGEPGTVSWLRSELRQGDVVYDIGANVGLYTVFAARHGGAGGHVYAFEPHVANARSLLRNVLVNGQRDQVTVLSFALGEATAFFDLEYDDDAPGSGMSTLGASPRKSAEEHGTCKELKYVTSVDSLLEQGVLRPPQLVKIDVEGGELGVLKGMRGLLGSRNRRPRSIQVEIDADSREPVIAYLGEHGYLLREEHRSGVSQRLAEKGASGDVVVNAVFSMEA